MPFTTTFPRPLASPTPKNPERVAQPQVDRCATIADTRLWCALAVGSLVGAGLLSLAVVIGRLPVLSRIIDDPLFFKRCLVVHVDLALIVWFYAFMAGLLALGGGRNRITGAAFTAATCGVLAMIAGGLMRGAQPVLANYVPVIDHPLFTGGLTAFFVGVLIFFVHSLANPAPSGPQILPADARLGLESAALLAVIAATTWVAARAGLPEGVDPYTRAEFLAWGPGHVLQAANACAMLSVWLWLLGRATGAQVLSRRVARVIFGALVVPQAAMPLLTARGTLDTLYHTGATQLMRWTIFPATLAVLVVGIVHLRRHRVRQTGVSVESKVALIGFTASAALAVLGMILGACIRGSTTLVPAHYHASLGAVTVAFMTAAYFVCDHVRRRSGTGFQPVRTVRTNRTHGLESPCHFSSWRVARWQLALFGVGQTIFVLGFALGGAYGLGRKAYAAEQHVRSAGELCGLVVMGLGGLVAVAGGLWFLALVLREIRSWWQRTPVAPAARPNPLLP